ncbi:hypothetical protein BN903_75 [Halorubrum sp. AJ67]|nr:hypothetical protein BN903_75 [Halorubrum sp. AJ67]
MMFGTGPSLACVREISLMSVVGVGVATEAIPDGLESRATQRGGDARPRRDGCE